MTPETENLLFSVVTSGEEVSATEALLSFGVFQSCESVPPLFTGNAVGKPIPVMTEGEYHLKTKVGNQEKYKPVRFTKEDIERIAKRQPRDVPFNYDHRRSPGRDGVKGWLRFGKYGEQPLHYVGQVVTPEGETLTALFATPELSEEAQQMVTSGIYRDVSIEYRGTDDVLTGCALTSYPVMRNLQFSDLTEEEAASEPVSEVSPVTVITAEPTEVALSENPQEEDEVKIEEMSKEDRTKLLNTLLADHDMSLQTIKDLSDKFSEMETKQAQTKHELALSNAEREINELLGDSHFGMTDEVATQAQEALAWSATNETLNFGEDGGAADVPGAIKALLGVIGKQGKQIALLAGETVGTNEDGEEQFGEVEEDTDSVDIDKSRVSSLASLAKRYL